MRKHKRNVTGAVGRHGGEPRHYIGHLDVVDTRQDNDLATTAVPVQQC